MPHDLLCKGLNVFSLENDPFKHVLQIAAHPFHWKGETNDDVKKFQVLM